MPDSPMPALTLRNLYQMMEEDSRLRGLSHETRHALRRYLPALRRLMEREEEREAIASSPGRPDYTAPPS
jgi:hypothetical protein